MLIPTAEQIANAHSVYERVQVMIFAGMVPVLRTSIRDGKRGLHYLLPFPYATSYDVA